MSGLLQVQEYLLMFIYSSEEQSLCSKAVTVLFSPAVTSPLTLDTNSAHPLLSISDDLRSVIRVKSRLPCATHTERFDHWPQVLTVQTFSSGTHYWELETEGFWDVAVCYRSIGRKGKEGNAFGNNKVLQMCHVSGFYF